MLNISAARASEAAMDVEAIARSGSLVNVSKSLTVLKSEVERLVSALTEMTLEARS
jgi:hypothetical protein